MKSHTFTISVDSTGTISIVGGLLGLFPSAGDGPNADSNGNMTFDEGVFDSREYDLASLYVEFASGSSAVVEIRRNHTGNAGDGVAFSPVQAVTASASLIEAVEIAGMPAIELTVSTAGASGEQAIVHLYRYSRNAAA